MSDDPVRLRDDPRLSNALRRDLARASQGGAAAPGFDVSAALASFEAARVGSTGPRPRSPSANTAVRSARWWGIGAVGVATLIAAVMFARRPWHSTSSSQTLSTAPVAAPTAPGPANPSSGSATPPVAVTSPGASSASAESTGETRPVRNAAGTRTGSSGPVASRDSTEPPLRGASSGAPPAGNGIESGASGHRPAASAHVAPASVDDLGRDERMLTDTYALLDIDPSRALASANAGIREFPDSRHLEDREAIAVRALAALHRSAEARARGQRFLARWPSSPQGLMVRQAMIR